MAGRGCGLLNILAIFMIWHFSGIESQDFMGPDAAKAYVDKVVTEHPVVVFSKSYCRDWPAVKQILDSYNLQPPYQPYVVNLNYMDNMFSIQNYLEKTTGARTVPRVFISGRPVGGADEVAMLYKSGKLTEILRQAGARV